MLDPTLAKALLNVLAVKDVAKQQLVAFDGLCQGGIMDFDERYDCQKRTHLFADDERDGPLHFVLKCERLNSWKLHNQ